MRSAALHIAPAAAAIVFVPFVVYRNLVYVPVP